MPRCKKVDSLKSMCIDNICTYMESFWYEKYWKDIYSSPERLMSEVGPFEYLPRRLVEEIAEELYKKPCVRDIIFSALITSTLSKFTMPEYYRTGSTTFDLLSIKCQDILKELKLSKCIFDNKDLIKAIKSLSKLEVLNLDQTKIGNDVLGVVGSHCDKLRKLNLHGCRSVTDKGIEYLLVDGFHRYGKCKQLENLNITDTKVSEYGIETVLGNAPKLQNLACDNVIYVLGKMHGNDLEANSPLIQYSLTSLRAEYRTEYDYLSSFSNSLSIAVQVCPRITDVFLNINWDEEVGDVLRPIFLLKILKNLDIRCYGCEQPDFFFSEIVPVLSVSGQSITRLHLDGFPWVDVGIIGVCCPLLEDFCLCVYNEYVLPQSRKEIFIPPASNKKSFSFLRILHVSMGYSESHRRGHYDFTPCHWKEMLSSRHLESLTIEFSSSLTDGVLSEVINAGQTFPKLRKLDLFGCPNITSGFVRSFLDLPNPLETINLDTCKEITQSDCDSLKSFCVVNGFDVDMELCAGCYNAPGDSEREFSWEFYEGEFCVII